jgi:DNA-binding transcriptional regulator PaaX
MSEKLWDGFWDFVVLQPLSLQVLSDGEMHLKSIYAAIEEEGRLVGIKEHLFKTCGRYGDRPDYTHVVRSKMHNLKNQGMVEHVGPGRTGKYRITDLGRKRLTKIEPG